MYGAHLPFNPVHKNKMVAYKIEFIRKNAIVAKFTQVAV